MDLDTSELLLGDRLAPITSNIGFIETDLTKAAEGFIDWQEQITTPVGVKVGSRRVHGSLENVLRSLLPLNIVGANRNLFVPTSSPWTAYVDSGYRGTDPSPLMYLARRLHCRTLWLIAKPHTLKRTGTPRRGRQGALILEVYGPEQTEHLNLVRQIRLQNDAGRWEFLLQGRPLPFEELERYQSRRLVDRFTFEMMKKYLGALGLSPFDEAFYLPSSKEGAILVELSGGALESGGDLTLEEARRKNGIEA